MGVCGEKQEREGSEWRERRERGGRGWVERGGRIRGVRRENGKEERVWER